MPAFYESLPVGSLEVVNNYVVTQHRLGFAEVSDWSRPPAPPPQRRRCHAHFDQTLWGLGLKPEQTCRVNRGKPMR